MTRDVPGKTGEHTKGRITPGRIPDVERQPCPRASKDDVVVFHSLTNIAGKTKCEFCKVTWADLDEQVRSEVRLNDNRRQRARDEEMA